MCLAVWYSKNCLVFEGKEEDPKQSVAKAVAIVESYKQLKIPNDQAISCHSKNRQLVWTTPPSECFKVNVDVAINVPNQKAGLGAVIRNFSGRVVAAAVQRVAYRGNVACVEAEAMLLGIQSAEQADCFPRIIESDSKEVVDLSLNKKSSKTEISWKITEIQARMKNQNSSSITYVPRGCNYIAHFIAKVALDFESQVLWLENFSEQIMCLFSNFT